MLFFKEITKTLILDIPETACVEKLSLYSRSHFPLLDSRSFRGEFISVNPPVFECTLVSVFLNNSWKGLEKTKILVRLSDRGGSSEMRLHTKTGYYIIGLFVVWLICILKLLIEWKNGLNVIGLLLSLVFLGLIMAIDRVSKNMLVSRVTDAFQG